MAPQAHTDLTFLAARLHGRRSRMAESERLDELCGVPTVAELSRRLLGGIELPSAPALQRELTGHLAGEVDELRSASVGPLRELLDWELLRFTCSNLKVLLRGVLNQLEVEHVLAHVIELPGQDPAVAQRLASAKTVRELVGLVPWQELQEPLSRALRAGPDPGHAFFFDAALDQAWLRGMLARARALPSPDAGLVLAMIAQETRLFHLMLVFRGRVQQALEPALLLPWRVELNAAETRRFAAAVLEPRTILSGTDPGAVESTAWARLLLLANRAFRGSPMGEAAVAGYVVIRRIGVSNLITISEGVRAGLAPPVLRARLIAHTREAAHA